MLKIRFDDIPSGRTLDIEGAYEFVQITRDVIRVGEDGDTELAIYSNGMWMLVDPQGDIDQHGFSDVIVYAD